MARFSLNEYDPVFEEAGRQWNVDSRLLKAIAMQESNGDPGAVSNKGAQGLMQIMPQTGAMLGMTDPHDPVQSIFAGAKYLSQALDSEGSPEKALLYYHGGPDYRQNYGPESASYVPQVTHRYLTLASGDAASAKAANDDPLSQLPPPPAEPSPGSAPAGAGAPAAGAAPSGRDDPLSQLPPAPTAAAAPPPST